MVTTSLDPNKQAVARVFMEAFNQGKLAAIDDVVASTGLDHQHPNEPSFVDHLKEVVTALRTAFPDLHFEVTQIIGEGDWVSTYSLMTGTHTGTLGTPVIPSGRPAIPATGRQIRVPHMHMIRLENGKGVELLHLMDTFAMLGQLGVLPGPSPAA